MKTKMTKAMYGKSMMKKGGVKKSLPKAQTGKAVRSVDTNQYGSTGEVEKTNKKGATKFKTVEISNTGSSMTNPSSTPTARIDKTKYDKEGMETKGTTKDISVKKAQRMINRIGNKATMQKGGAMKKMQGGGIASTIKAGVNKAVKASAGPARKAAIADPNTKFPYTSPTGVVYENRAALESGSPSSRLTTENLKKTGKMKKGGSTKSLPKAQAGKALGVAKGIGAARQANKNAVLNNPNTKYPYATSSGVVYANKENYKSGSPDSNLTIQNLKRMGKMKTGGMVNPNSSVSKQTVPGSRGVRSGVNPKASSSKVAGSRGAGRANNPPSKAVPTAKRGGMVKKKR